MKKQQPKTRTSKYYWSIRDNKSVSATLDPNAQDRLDHIKDTFKHIYGLHGLPFEVSNTILIRRAVLALSDYLDDLIETNHLNSVSKHEMKLIDRCTRVTDLASKGIIPTQSDKPMTFREKLGCTLKINAEESRIAFRKFMEHKPTLKELLEEKEYNL